MCYEISSVHVISERKKSGYDNKKFYYAIIKSWFAGQWSGNIEKWTK